MPRKLLLLKWWFKLLSTFVSIFYFARKSSVRCNYQTGRRWEPFEQSWNSSWAFENFDLLNFHFSNFPNKSRRFRKDSIKLELSFITSLINCLTASERSSRVGLQEEDSADTLRSISAHVSACSLTSWAISGINLSPAGTSSSLESCAGYWFSI